MASTTTNVFRWGALVLGVFYGFSHQGAINSQDRTAAAKQEWERKEKLISDAKAAWAEKNRPAGFGDGVTTNPEDPKFDLEKYFAKVQKENP